MTNFNSKNMLVNLNYVHVIPHELHIFMQYKGGKFDIAHVGFCMPWEWTCCTLDTWKLTK